MERSTIFHGKTHYFYGNFQELFDITRGYGFYSLGFPWNHPGKCDNRGDNSHHHLPTFAKCARPRPVFLAIFPFTWKHGGLPCFKGRCGFDVPSEVLSKLLQTGTSPKLEVPSGYFLHFAMENHTHAIKFGKPSKYRLGPSKNQGELWMSVITRGHGSSKSPNIQIPGTKTNHLFSEEILSQKPNLEWPKIVTHTMWNKKKHQNQVVFGTGKCKLNQWIQWLIGSLLKSLWKVWDLQHVHPRSTENPRCLSRYRHWHTGGYPALRGFLVELWILFPKHEAYLLASSFGTWNTNMTPFPSI